jgi:glycosyltransferase involved in cell wall biosynthesis
MASWPLALPALLRGRGTRIVLSAHGTDVAYPRRGDWKGRLYGAYLRLGARLLRKSAVIANSRATAELARGFGFGRVRVVALGTDLRAPAPDGQHNGDVLFAGRLVARKGCGWFVREVLPLLPEGVGLRVAGTLWDDAEAHVPDHPRVRFLGPLSQTDLARAYAEALCVVVPNLPVADRAFEGFGLVAVEAAAGGGLVLASKHDGLRESVIDGETGRHLPPGDAAAWAEAIREIAALDAGARRAAAARAMEAVDRHFRWDRVARETARAYDAPR